MFPFFMMDQTRHLIIIVQRDVDKEQKYESQKYLQKLIRNSTHIQHYNTALGKTAFSPQSCFKWPDRLWGENPRVGIVLSLHFLAFLTKCDISRPNQPKIQTLGLGQNGNLNQCEL